MAARADEVGAVAGQVRDDAAKLAIAVLVFQAGLDLGVAAQGGQRLEAVAILASVAAASVLGRALPGRWLVASGLDQVEHSGERLAGQDCHAGGAAVGPVLLVGGLAIDHGVTSIVCVSTLLGHRQGHSVSARHVARPMSCDPSPA